jgi:hypothetical protein
MPTRSPVGGAETIGLGIDTGGVGANAGFRRTTFAFALVFFFGLLAFAFVFFFGLLAFALVFFFGLLAFALTRFLAATFFFAALRLTFLRASAFFAFFAFFTFFALLRFVFAFFLAAIRRSPGYALYAKSHRADRAPARSAKSNCRTTYLSKKPMEVNTGGTAKRGPENSGGRLIVRSFQPWG